MAGDDDAAMALARAESAFAAQSVREDMRAAFIANFADDGVLVRGEWVNARDWLSPRAPPPIVLDWHPAFVVVAQSADLGVSTGPWRATKKDAPAEPPAVGEFASVWRRDAQGPWRVIVDLGVSHRDASTWERPLHAERNAPASAPATSFADAEAGFAALSASRGLHAAYAAYGSTGMRVLRPGLAPFIGPDAMRAPLVSSDERMQWTVDRGETSRAGDFGYARGRYAKAGASAQAIGEYLRVWRVERGEWRILLDVTNPR